MMNNTEKLRNILNNYEVDYNPQDWNKLEKNLPKSTKYIYKDFTKISIITASVACIIALVFIFIFTNPLDTKDNNKTIIKNTQIDNTNKSNKLEETTKIESIASNPESINIEKQTTDTKNKNTIIDSNPLLSEEKPDDKTNNVNKNKNRILVETIRELDDKKPEDNNIEIFEAESIDYVDDRIVSICNNKDEPIKDKITASFFNVEINNNCIPAIVTFTAKQPLDKNYNIIWIPEDGKSIMGNTIKYTYTSAGTFYPKVRILTSEQELLKETELEAIIIHSPSKLSISYTEIDKQTYNFFSLNEENLVLNWTIDKDKFVANDIIYSFNDQEKHIIKLNATNDFGCKTEVTEELIIENHNLFYLPDAFIPLSNGKNSEFGPIGENLNFTSFKFIILNDKGNIIFTSYNPDQKWNGKTNNTGANPKSGIYFWEINAVDMYNNTYKQKGKVTLIIK